MSVPVAAALAALLAACGEDTSSTEGAGSTANTTTTTGPSTSDETTGSEPTSASTDTSASSEASASATTDTETNATTEGPTSSTGDPDTTSPTTDATDTTDPTTDPTTDATDTTDPTTGEPAVCGDGVVTPGELCDDGNLEADDGCEADCTWTPCAILWSKNHDLGDLYTRGVNVAALDDGDLALAVNDQTGQNDGRMRLTRVDAAGEEVWTTLVVDVRSEGFAVTVAADGTIVIAGQDISGPFTADLVAGYSGDGQKLWQHDELFEVASARAVAAFTDGVVTGGYRGLADVGWLARFETSGTEVWKQEQMPAGWHDHRVYALASDGDEFYVSGMAKPEGEVWAAGWISRHNAAGDLLWFRTHIEDGTNVQFFDVDVGPGGVASVAVEHFIQGSDFAAESYSADGELLWSDVYNSGGGQTFDHGQGVIVDEFGNTTVVGWVQPEPPLYRGHIRKYDGGGGLICERTVDVGGGVHTQFFDVAIAADGLPRIVGRDHKALYIAALTP